MILQYGVMPIRAILALRVWKTNWEILYLNIDLSPVFKMITVIFS